MYTSNKALTKWERFVCMNAKFHNTQLILAQPKLRCNGIMFSKVDKIHSKAWEYLINILLRYMNRI